MATRTLLAVALVVAGCGKSGQPAAESGDRAAPSAPSVAESAQAAPVAGEPAPAPGPVQIGLADLGLDDLDAGRDPCTDFYGYVCGEARSTLAERRTANDALLARSVAGDSGPAGALYRQCGADADRDSAGLGAATALLEAARGVASARDLSRALGLLHRHRVWAGFSVAVAPDFADGRRTVLHVDAGGLVLGDRDYYLEAKDSPDRGEDFRALRRRYLAAIGAAVEAAGGSRADGKRVASGALRLERELARWVRSRYERRAPRLLADRVSRAQLGALARRIDWDAYFAALGAGKVSAVNLTERRALLRLDRMVKTMSWSTWRGYLEWHVLHSLAPHGPAALASAGRAADAVVDGGRAPVADPCVGAVAAAYPDLAGDLVAAERMPDGRRGATRALVGAIARAHADEIRAVGWLTADTRERAGAKVDAIDIVVGVADWTRAGDAVTPGGYLEGILAARARETARQLATLGSEAGMAAAPTAPGARYEWLGNRLVLGPGSYGLEQVAADRPVAAALGALATTAGYGIAMATGDQGGRWTERGALATWWTEADIAGYREASACLMDRAKRYRGPGAPVDPVASLARARADRAGLSAAYRAYKSQPVNPAVELRGANRDQLFFLAAARALCSAAPAARWRVNGAFADTPAFAEAFQCATGADMNPAKRCR